MSIFRAYTSPTDPRWHGTPRRGPLFLLPITALYILTWIFFISDQIYTHSLWNHYASTYASTYASAQKTKDYTHVPHYPPVRWGGSDPDGWQLFIWRTVFALFPELLHLPLTHYLTLTSKLHPVYALSSGLVFGCLWFISAFWALLGIDPAFTEYGYSEEELYEELVYAGGALQVVLIICYIVYVVFAAKAVHKWRGAKKEAKRGVELREGARTMSEEERVESV